MFRGGSDCELIVHLYEEHGEDLFPHLKGQFAFVLFDFAKRMVIMARDRVICPLHWSRQGDFVYFGSEIKALLASGAVAPVTDTRGLDHLFTFFALGTRRTLFEGVQCDSAWALSEDRHSARTEKRLNSSSGATGISIFPIGARSSMPPTRPR